MKRVPLLLGLLLLATLALLAALLWWPPPEPPNIIIAGAASAPAVPELQAFEVPPPVAQRPQKQDASAVAEARAVTARVLARARQNGVWTLADMQELNDAAVLLPKEERDRIERDRLEVVAQSGASANLP